jgi:hypothetical protein
MEKEPEEMVGPEPASAEAEPSMESLTCPNCGVSLSSGVIHLVERVESSRQVFGVAEGQIRVSSLYDTNADDGGGEDPHFECHNRLAESRSCDHRWPVPAWVKARMVLV